METATRGIDYDGVGNTWHGDLEQLYAGARWEDKARQPQLDVSYGQQNLVLGQSFLIAAGASNGAQRGARLPRAAHRVGQRRHREGDDRRRHGAGLLAQAQRRDVRRYRHAHLRVSRSRGTAKGRCAAPRCTCTFPRRRSPRATASTSTTCGCAGIRSRAPPNAWLQGEYAWQRKSGVAARGWYAALNYNAKDAAWKPLAMLRYAWFSGDKPGTSNGKASTRCTSAAAIPTGTRASSAARSSTTPTSRASLRRSR